MPLMASPRQLGQVKPKQHQYAHHHDYSNAQPRLKQFARRADPRHHGSRKEQTAGAAAQVGHIVDIQPGVRHHMVPKLIERPSTRLSTAK